MFLQTKSGLISLLCDKKIININDIVSFIVQLSLLCILTPLYAPLLIALGYLAVKGVRSFVSTLSGTTILLFYMCFMALEFVAIKFIKMLFDPVDAIEYAGVAVLVLSCHVIFWLFENGLVYLIKKYL